MSVLARPPAAAAFHIGPAQSAITIDGVLDEPAWANATIIPLSYEYQPGDNTTPPVKTDCLVTYDIHTFYVAFRADDPEPSALFLEPTDARTRRLFSQYLFSYKLNPQTVLLVGYSDTYQGLVALPRGQTNRTFFVKVGYAWLL